MRSLLSALALGVITLSATAIPNDAETVRHVLNRITFGPRDSDVERVRALGLQRYVEEQLHPERIPDAAIGVRLAGLTTLTMTTREIAATFEAPLVEARRAQKQDGKAEPDPDAPKMPTPVQMRANSVLVELGQQKILRAVYSDRQLQEVLTDFWFNHFNVDARKGRDRFMLTEYERDVIRPHVLGSFRDLLGATAKSPAMLFYLDNWMSVDPNGPHQAPASQRYGRVRRTHGRARNDATASRT